MRPLIAAAALAVTMGAQPRGFDVASIHLSSLAKSGLEGTRRNEIRHTPKSLTMRNVTLLDCLMFAYGVTEQQVAGPDWLGVERYDIAASTSDPVSRAELKRMLQPVLTDRFKLALRHDTKDLAVYALVVLPSGPKLERAQPETGSSLQISGGAFVFEDTTMGELAQKLSQLTAVDRLVVDQTEISGSFNFKIRMAANDETMRSDAVHGQAPSIFPLIERQLGLKLEARKMPMDMLVVDRAQRIPTEN
jgi:uncharacterized protein (TIGR03435 family)